MLEKNSIMIHSYTDQISADIDQSFASNFSTISIGGVGDGPERHASTGHGHNDNINVNNKSKVSSPLWSATSSSSISVDFYDDIGNDPDFEPPVSPPLTKYDHNASKLDLTDVAILCDATMASLRQGTKIINATINAVQKVTAEATQNTYI